MAKGIVVALALLTGDWQSLLITPPPKQCSKLFFFPLPCSLASRLLQWKLLRHAAMQATTATATALPGAQWPTDAPWTPMQ